MIRSKPDQFEYINNYYSLDLKKHRAVEETDDAGAIKRRGQVVKADGAHIYIQWDGEPKPNGPYHPTYNLRYP